MRPSPALLKRLGQAGGFVLLGGAVAALGVRIDLAAPTAPRHALTAEAKPLEAELARCRRIDRPEDVDAACRAAWAELRRRFFLDTSSRGARP